ncbi:MAG: SOS response-associated peptidase [Oscillochloris sp.]|nr:SOS response-associated peptidase [Oscillochloris sp.]
MCGRYTLAISGEQAQQQFALPTTPTLAPRYNIAPTQSVAVVRAAEQRRDLALLRWGLIPGWAKDAAIGARMINARGETVAEKPAFKHAMRRRRCLIPADGFYEWQATAEGKQPIYFQMADGTPFAFAGLWEQWRGPDGPVESCTIITTSANELVHPVHDRMPVIVAPDDYVRWLAPELDDAAAVADLIKPFPADRMQSYMVSKAVNQVRNNGPELIAPAGV